MAPFDRLHTSSYSSSIVTIIIIIIKNECHSTDFKVAATAESCGKVKVSHAAVKSFDRRSVSCKNARTVQFSGGVEMAVSCIAPEIKL